MRRRLILLGALGLAVTLIVWVLLPGKVPLLEVDPLTADAERSVSLPGVGRSSEGRAGAAPAPAPSRQTVAAPLPKATIATVSPSVRTSTTAAIAVPISVTAPRDLLVGEMNDLIIAVGPNTGLREVSLSVQFDANVLQARAVTEGEWATSASVDARSFAAEITGAEDHVRIRSTVTDKRTGWTGGTVSIVQFQAVAPGVTTVTISDVSIKDLAGISVPSTLPTPDLQVTVNSAALPVAAEHRQRSATAVEAGADTSGLGD